MMLHLPSPCWSPMDDTPAGDREKAAERYAGMLLMFRKPSIALTCGMAISVRLVLERGCPSHDGPREPGGGKFQGRVTKSTLPEPGTLGSCNIGGQLRVTRDGFRQERRVVCNPALAPASSVSRSCVAGLPRTAFVGMGLAAWSYVPRLSSG